MDRKNKNDRREGRPSNDSKPRIKRAEGFQKRSDTSGQDKRKLFKGDEQRNSSYDRPNRSDDRFDKRDKRTNSDDRRSDKRTYNRTEKSSDRPFKKWDKDKETRRSDSSQDRWSDHKSKKTGPRHSDRNDRPDRSNRFERSDRNPRFDRSDRTERTGRDRGFKSGEKNYNQPSDRNPDDRFKRSDRSERSNRPERSDRTERPGRINRTERNDRRQHGDRPAYSDRSERGSGNTSRDKSFKRGSDRDHDGRNDRSKPFRSGPGDRKDNRRSNSDRTIKRPTYEKTAKEDVKRGLVKDIIRLNKFISNAGICSRREADTLIETGAVEINGTVVQELGTKVNKNDEIKVNGKVIQSESKVYLLLNKPRGFITTLKDPEGRRTVMELIASAGQERIYPVGRLDRDTSGLLLFTNDGELAERLSHPRNEVKKIYHVEIDKDLTQAHFDDITNNLITLEDGQVIIDGFNLLDGSRRKMGIQIHEGRNRIVRRLFEHLGYEVVKLDRTVYADLDKKELPRGNWRFLKDKEVLRLKHFNIR